MLRGVAILPSWPSIPQHMHEGLFPGSGSGILFLPPSWLVNKTYHQHVGTGEVLSLAPKQKKLSNVCATIDLLNQELSDFGYSSYTFLRGFASHLAQQCALPDGDVCKQEEGGYSLNSKLLNPLWRSIGALQDVLDHLKASIQTS